MKFGPVALAAASFVGALWFGTEDSYIAYLDAMAQVQQLEAAGPESLKAAVQMRGGGRGEDPFGLPSMMNVHGDVGIVDIKGSLVNGEAGFYRLFGITGYEDVKAAIGDALDDKNVKRIVLNIDSGGGAVNGVEDAGAFIRKAAQIKPIVAFSGGTMGSAAYWLGVSADKVLAGKTAMVGSVGTLIVHMEMTKALAESGRKATIFRHGEYKALGHPYEPLSDKAKEHFQAMADEGGKIFVAYAAERRGTTPEKFQKTMGEGRVFMGQQAHEVGLIDAVASLETVMTSAKSLDKRSSTVENSRHSARNPDMKIRALSKAVLLAIAGGTKLEALGLSSEAANVEGVKPEAEDVTALTADATEIHSAFTAATATAVTAAVSTAKAESDKVVAGLSAKVALLEAGAGDLTGKVTAANEMAASYASVVKGAITTMSVALGAADTGASLQGAALMAEHDRLKEAFLAKFPSGGVTATTASTSKQGDGAAPKAPPAAFLAAVGGFRKN